MIPLDKAVLIKYEKGEHRFEILADPDKALKIKEKGDISLLANLDDVLASLDIYKDAKKGELAPEESIKEVFGPAEDKFIIFKIIKDGTLHLTTEQKKKMATEKRKKIIDLITRQAIDPQTGLPHPAARIERAMEEARVHIDPVKPAERQIDDIVNAIRPILPIKIAKARIEIRVPPSYATRVYGYLKQLGITKEEWKNDGSLDAILEIPAGMQTEVFEKLNSMTKGDIYSKLVKII